MNDQQKLKDRLNKVLEAPNLVEFFEKNAKFKPFDVKKGTVLSNEGQPLERIFVIKEGFVKIFNLSVDGKETVSYLLGPGYVLGARAFLSTDESAIHSAEALTDLKLISLSHTEYLNLISENPDYLVDLLQVFINRLDYTEKKLAGFITGNTTVRVANFLLDSLQRFDGEGNALPIPLTHQRIAEFIGASREAVTLAMNQLEKEDIIIDQSHRITILDLEKLKKYSS